MSGEEVLLLPPWPKKRRIIAAVILTGFILFAAGFIGVGIYQIGLQRGFIKQPVTKKVVTSALYNDTEFLRAIRHAGLRKVCKNPTKRFTLSYQAPLHPLLGKPEEETCQHFVAIHPTGADIFVDVETKAESREKLMQQYAETFDAVQADTLSGTHYQIGRLSGMRNGVSTVMYVIGTNISSSWVLTYKLTSPTLNATVQDMATSFRLY